MLEGNKMLDTVLEIGRVLRASTDGLKHHRYIKRAPVPDEKKNPVRFWRVPVNEDGSFDFSQIEPLDDENRQKRLFYLNYKIYDNANQKLYVFGDIYRVYDFKKKKEIAGNFLLGTDDDKGLYKQNSFKRATTMKLAALQVSDRMREFRASFERQWLEVKEFMQNNSYCYIHFDFFNKHWHETAEFELLNKTFLDLYFKDTQQGYISRAFLYKTLGTSSSSTPGFVDENRHKNRVFVNSDQAMDLFYGINYALCALRLTTKAFDVKIVVLPRGEGLTAPQIERFFDHTGSIEAKGDEAEEEVRSEVEDSTSESLHTGEEDELFAMLTDDPQTRTIAQFDFIFSKAGGTKADIDMIELAGLERSNLSLIRKRVRQICEATETERAAFQFLMYGKPPNKPLASLRIMRSFLNILSNKTRSEKKYQRHLYRVLPQIYTASYYQDSVLLPAFIERTEANIRNGMPNFNLLKFDFYFLTRLQDYKGDRILEIQKSSSYQVGILLGKLAKQFSGSKSPIKSFEKNYVGLLSRRLTTLPDVVELSNDINQKLVMHELSKYTFHTSSELADHLKTFTGRYDKNECAFGFFESYFAPLPIKETGDGVDAATE